MGGWIEVALAEKKTNPAPRVEVFASNGFRGEVLIGATTVLIALGTALQRRYDAL